MRPDRDTLALRAVYFAYLGANGLMGTYWAWHFTEIGLSGTQIGLLFGVRAVISTLSQPALASAADRYNVPIRFLRWGLTIGFVGLAALPFLTSFAAIAAVFWGVSPALAVAIPLVDATVVVRYGVERYGRFRLWGSIGYGLVVAGFGLGVAALTYAEAGALAVSASAVAMAAAALAAWLLRRDPARERRDRARTGVRWSAGLVTFFAVNSLHWSAVMIFNLYLGKLVELRGWSTSVPGLCVAVAIIAEVAALAVAARLLSARDAAAWFPLVAIASAARWALMAICPTPALLIALQVLHLLSFGVWIASAMSMLGRFAPPSRRPTLQGWFSAAVLGTGGLFGSAIGGGMLDLWGADGAFYVAAGLEVVAVLGYLVFARTWPTSDAVERLPVPADTVTG